MIGTSRLDYAFIQLCIWGLSSIPVLSVAYCSALTLDIVLRLGVCPRLPLPVAAWMITETIFFAFIHFWYRGRLQREAQHPPTAPRHERRLLVDRCNATITNPEAYLRKWFLGAPLEEIKRDNMAEFLLWAFFNRDGLPADDEEEVDEYMSLLEAKLGRKFEEGRGSARCLRLTLDPVKMLPRSLLWYWCVGFVDVLTIIKLYLAGYHLHRLPVASFFTALPFRPLSLLSKFTTPVKHTTYWHRPHTSKDRLPILFIHGIGIGLYPYTQFLTELNSPNDPDGQIGIIALELMPVSFRITHPVLSSQAMCDEIHAILDHHGWTDFILVSHSYGTVISTQLLRDARLAERIDSVLLIDPITILLHYPDVAYNFTHRTPRSAPEHQLHYFASMDMAVSHALSRCFFWSEYIVWKEDLDGHRVTVSLGERDIIVNARAVAEYLDWGTATSTANGSTTANGTANGSSTANGHVNGKIPPSRRLKNGHAVASSESKFKDNHRSDSPLWRGEGVDLIWNAGLDHAQVFDKRKTRARLVHAARMYSARR